MKKMFLALIVFWFITLNWVDASEPVAKHVILISFDGLRPDAVTTLGPVKASAFYRIMKEGASTLNARSDYDYTVTLPNHTCMITGCPVLGPLGHHVTENTLVSKSVHDFAGRHINSIFDLLRQNKMSTAMIVSKLKFNIFSKSFPIDTVSITDQDDAKTLENILKIIKEGLPNFVFLHFSNPDHAGHKHGWSIKLDSAYMKQVEILNGYLQNIMEKIESDPVLKDSTVLIVTSDHGGQDQNHGNNKKRFNYTIPFMVWGKGVAGGSDLYKLNLDRRKNPFNARINYVSKNQPIRNGDAANLVVVLLGLSSIEGSSIGSDKHLKINKE